MVPEHLAAWSKTIHMCCAQAHLYEELADRCSSNLQSSYQREEEEVQHEYSDGKRPSFFSQKISFISIKKRSRGLRNVHKKMLYTKEMVRARNRGDDISISVIERSLWTEATSSIIAIIFSFSWEQPPKSLAYCHKDQIHFQYAFKWMLETPHLFQCFWGAWVGIFLDMSWNSQCTERTKLSTMDPSRDWSKTIPTGPTSTY